VRPIAEKWVNRRRKPEVKTKKPRKALAVHNLSSVFYHFLSVKNGVDSCAAEARKGVPNELKAVS
jgi:hypothetical protein